jgi:hypothetical protein
MKWNSAGISGSVITMVLDCKSGCPDYNFRFSHGNDTLKRLNDTGAYSTILFHLLKPIPLMLPGRLPETGKK